MATMTSSVRRSAVGQRAAHPARARVALNTQAFLGMLNPSKERTAKKDKLLSMIKRLDRGIAAGPEERLAVEKVIQSLEGMNPTPRALKSDLVNGKWELLYTTNTNIIGGNRPAIFRPSGAFYQVIDAPNGKVHNLETSPYYNSIDAEITPVTKSRVDVTFKKLHLLGIIPLTAPDWMKGWLDVTYLDEEIRISRGDLGNVFVLRRAD